MKLCSFLLKPFFFLLDCLKPWVDLLARCWVAWIFFKAGFVKIQHFQATIQLFTHEYQVPFLSPMSAAVIGMISELLLPLLLIIGLGGRMTILIFFIYNIVAAISYPHLWTSAGWFGLKQHINWALLLALLMTHGPGRISMDHWLKKRYGSSTTGTH